MRFREAEEPPHPSTCSLVGSHTNGALRANPLPATLALAACFLLSSLAKADGPPKDELEASFGERARLSVERPVGSQRLICTRAVCMHASPGPAWSGTTMPGLGPLVEQAQRIHDSLLALGHWAPLHDAGRGGDNRLDVYLDPTLDGAHAVADSPGYGRGPDRRPTFVRLGLKGLHNSCVVGSRLARGLAQSFILSADPAVHEGVLGMHASYFASLLAPCPALEWVAVDAFQRHPEHALTHWSAQQLSGQLLFPAFLDTYYGPGNPGATMNALLALASQTSSNSQLHWQNEPDIFDAARRLLKPLGRSLGDLLLEFSIARAFVGNRCDGAHMEDVDRFGDMGRVRFEWALGLASLPRRLAPLKPLAPTAATYLWLDTRNASAKDRLTVAIEWEESHVFHWALVRVDAQGREISRHPGGGVWGSTKLRLSLSKLDDTDAVLIVGTHVGNDDRSHPYDPDAGASRRASYEITLYNQ